jgi:hypothetical protein
MSTPSLAQRLEALEHQISGTEGLAEAENAFGAAHPEAENPWAGAAQKLLALHQERDHLALALQGQRLSSTLAKQRELRERLEALMVQRQVADRVVLERAQHPTVVRYLGAGAICRQRGWAWSFSRFMDWYETKRERVNGLPEDAAWFLDSPQAREAGVYFNTGTDREAVHLYREAQGAAEAALMAWNAVRSELELLIREHPEITAVD